MRLPRILACGLLSGALTAAAVTLPVVTLPVPQAQAVPPAQSTIQLTDESGTPTPAVGVAAGRTSSQGTEAAPAQQLTSPQTPVAVFDVVAVTWDKDAVVAPAVEVRVREDGQWSAWQALETEDAGPDAGSDEAANVLRAGTSPLFANRADGVQVRAVATTGPDGSQRLPGRLQIDTIDARVAAADDHVEPTRPIASADAAVGMPSIIGRAQWGADESLRRGEPTYSGTLKAATVHHTADSNDYDAAGAVRMLRAIYAYHTQSLGWSDIGYNFVVDKFGRIFEGRAGGWDRNVIGAHAGGFNTDTFGVSAIGNYNDAAAPAAMVDAISRLIAWKLAAAYGDPESLTTLTSAGGGTSKYPAGQRVTLPVVFGHRDVGSTACPGANLYAQLQTIRDSAQRYMALGLVQPAVSATSIVKGGSLAVSAGVLTNQGYRLRIVDRCTGRDVWAVTGTASRSQRIAQTWDGRGPDGQPVGAGSYTAELVTWVGNDPGVPYSVDVDVTVSPPPQAPASALAAGLGYVPVTPTRLLDTRAGDALNRFSRVDVPVLGRAGIPASGVGAVALNVTGTCATRSTYLTVSPAGSPTPASSSVNFGPGRSSAALVTAAVGGDGKVSILNGQGSADVVVDVMGYFPVSGGNGFVPTTATRVLDTRGGARLTNGDVRTVDLNGIPGASSVTAVLVNVTATGSAGEGYATAFAAGQPLPGTSTVNYLPGADVANRAVVPVSGGRFSLAGSGSSSDLVVDLVGVFSSGATQTFTPLQPSRALDTRASGGPLAAGATRTLAVRGDGLAVPAGATAAVVTITSTGTQGPGTYVTAWASGQARTATSDLNAGPGRDQANLAVVPIGADGQIALYSSGRTDLLVDVLGYYR